MVNVIFCFFTVGSSRWRWNITVTLMKINKHLEEPPNFLISKRKTKAIQHFPCCHKGIYFLMNIEISSVCVFLQAFRAPTCSPAFLTVAEGGWANGSQAEALGSLLSCCITGLVGMPQLLAVVTELCTAALPAARDLWTAGTPKGYYCISGRGQTKHQSDKITVEPF